MSFTLAALIVLAIGALVVALVAFNLLQRLDAIEHAVMGGLSTPSRQLSREEYGRRFATAQARTELADELGTSTVIFVDPEAPLTHEIVGVLDNMAQPRGFVVGVSEGTLELPAGVRVLPDVRSRLGVLGIAALPYVLVIDERTIVGSRPIGSVDAIRSFLLEVA